MALTENELENITNDAVKLRDKLTARAVSMNTANEWVGQAMMAIVLHETDEAGAPGPGPHQYTYTDDSGRWPLLPGKSDVTGDLNPLAFEADWPTAEQQAAKQAQLAREQARWGNVTPGDPGVHRPVAQMLALGPEPGRDMRLVTVRETGSPARTAAMRWVRENTPAGRITDTMYAGRAASGDPVYLVTYEVKVPGTQPAAASGLIDQDEPPRPGGPVHPVRSSDKPLG